jgi:cephalosporin-C deacetylase
MPLFDLPREQLETYRPARQLPDDLLAFWESTLSASRALPLDARFSPHDARLPGVQVWDLSFGGHAGQRIKGWFLTPSAAQIAALPAGLRSADGRLPCVVEYIGYGGGRGLPNNWLFWPAAGFALFVMDTRGQGSTWQTGDTPDVEPEGSSPSHPGYMTRGILDPASSYYRRVYTDAVRAVEAALTRPEVDPRRVFLTGGSQGGGITLAAASLLGRFPPAAGAARDLNLAGIMPDVPFLCHFRRATEITGSYPYAELVTFAKNHRHHLDRMFATLAYFDCVNLVHLAKAPALFSVALMDDICPPSTVYAAYNHYGSDAGAPPPRRDIRVWPYNGHEGGQQFQTDQKLAFARECLGLASSPGN